MPESADETKLKAMHQRVVKREKERQEAYVRQRDVQQKSEAALREADVSVQRATDVYQADREVLYRTAFETGIINRQVVDVLAPSHERSNCSDTMLDNVDSCTRCFMLRSIKDPYRIEYSDVLVLSHRKDVD